MQLSATGIVCGLRAHGEHGVIVRLMTFEAGLMAGYVRGGRSRRLRPILIPGNSVAAEFRARTAEQLPGLTIELLQSRAPLMSEPLAAAAMEWATMLTATTLAEGHPYPSLYIALNGVLDAISMAPAARGWAAAMAQFELVVLRVLGFGLSLETCVVTEQVDDLCFVSPKSAAAVSRSAAAGYESQLLPLPAFIRSGGNPSLADAMDGLRLSGFFVEQKLFDPVRKEALAVRQRMIDRLHRAIA